MLFDVGSEEQEGATKGGMLFEASQWHNFLLILFVVLADSGLVIFDFDDVVGNKSLKGEDEDIGDEDGQKVDV